MTKQRSMSYLKIHLSKTEKRKIKFQKEFNQFFSFIAFLNKHYQGFLSPMCNIKYYDGEDYIGVGSQHEWEVFIECSDKLVVEIFVLDDKNRYGNSFVARSRPFKRVEEREDMKLKEKKDSERNGGLRQGPFFEKFNVLKISREKNEEDMRDEVLVVPIGRYEEGNVRYVAQNEKKNEDLSEREQKRNILKRALRPENTFERIYHAPPSYNLQRFPIKYPSSLQVHNIYHTKLPSHPKKKNKQTSQ